MQSLGGLNSAMSESEEIHDVLGGILSKILTSMWIIKNYYLVTQGNPNSHTTPNNYTVTKQPMHV